MKAPSEPKAKMMLNGQRRVAMTIALGALTFVTLSIADSSPSADIIRTRQQALKTMGASLKTVRDQMRQADPDMTAIKEAGANIQKTAGKLEAWFPPGTGPEAGVKTAARPEIWADPNTFEQKRADLVAAAAVFSKITASGDKDAIRGAVAPLNRTCKSCHDKFYEE
jgi:cytochrome c556